MLYQYPAKNVIKSSTVSKYYQIKRITKYHKKPLQGIQILGKKWSIFNDIFGIILQNIVKI